MASKNSGSTIAEALDSIKSQSYSNYEVILVDANSTDETLKIADNYSWVKAVRQRGIGFADAWNCGLKEATGEMVSFLDSDDIWVSDKLELQVNFLLANPSFDVVIGKVRFFADKGKELPSTFRPELLMGEHLAHMPGAVMVRRHVFERIGLFDPDLSVASDIDWFAKLKDAGIKEGIIDRLLIHKRVHQSNLSYTGAKEPRYDRELLATLRRSILRQRTTSGSPPQSQAIKSVPQLVSRADFISRVRTHISDGKPYATGKLGISEMRVLQYPLVLRDEKDPRKLAAYLANVRFHALKQSGVFPDSAEFLKTYSDFYLDHLRNLDCIGFVNQPMTAELCAQHRLSSDVVYFEDQEPDRKIPADESNCYLPAMEGKRVLLISPFAQLLCKNATKERFEAVWKKTGKAWFNPEEIIPLEFPYGFAKATQERYSDVISLYNEICQKITDIKFDAALVSAAGLNIPIVSHIKRIGKVGIALGGHLQVVFGVLGKRWKERPEWMENYVTDSWLPMAEEYKPEVSDVADQGAYW